jgi:hypothetical protein
LVSSLHTRSSPSLKVISAAAVVTVGFFIGVAPSSSIPATAVPSSLSLFYGVLSSLFIALHAVLIKSSLPHCNNSTIQLAWWTNVGSAVFLLPAVILHGEPALLSNMIQSGTWDGTVFFWGSLITGLFGFLLCIAGLLSIKVTSPITHMFSSVRVVPFFVVLLVSHRLLPAGRTLCTSNASGGRDIQRYTHRVCLSPLNSENLSYSHDRNRGTSILVILGGTM